jgi:hypothetical protein
MPARDLVGRVFGIVVKGRAAARDAARGGRVPWGGVGAVGKWPAAATATSLAAAGHLSTAVVIADLR